MAKRFKVLTNEGVTETDGQVFLALVKNDDYLWVSGFIYINEKQLEEQMGKEQFAQAKALLKISVDLNKIQPIKEEAKE